MVIPAIEEMKVLIETCPECGYDLLTAVITTYPPIPVKQCYHCGWRWEGKADDIQRVPFVNDGKILNTARIVEQG